MSVLKQRVPLGSVEGSDVFITLEWLKDLQAVIAQGGGATTSTGTSASDLVALTAAFSTLNGLVVALTARVKKLEQGYQS